MRLNLRGKKTIVFIVAVSMALTAIGVLFFRTDNSQEIAKGRAYLKSLSSQDVTRIENQVKAQDAQTNKAAINQKMVQLERDPSKVWPLFKDYVILGDSRAVDFNLFLDEKYCLAEKNKTINHIKTKMDQVVSLNPRNIIIAYGLNDISIPRWKNINTYTADFTQILAALHKKLPHATIYVNSILPVHKYPEANYHRIPDYNVTIAKMCRSHGYVYINNSAMAAAHSGLYAQDGMHVQSSFYKYWGLNIMKAIYAQENNV